MSRGVMQKRAGTGASPRRQRGSARVVAIIMAVVFFSLIGAFVGMVFLDHSETRLNAVGPIARAPGIERGGVVFSGAAGTWEVKGQAAVDAERQLHFEFTLIGPGGQPASATVVPAVVFVPADGGAAVQPDVLRVAPGGYRASAALPADGPWNLRIELPEIAATLPFVVGP